MNRIRRLLLGLASAACLASMAPALAAYPDRPVRLIVPFPPGGAADVAARLIAAQLQQTLGNIVVVHNRPGAGTLIGAQAAAQSKPDGYTLFISSNSTFTLNPAIRNDLKFDPIKDFEPIGAVGTIPIVLAAHPTLPAQTLAAMIEQLRDSQQAMPYGSFGSGTVAHFAGEMFRLASGVNLTHVSYRGSAPAMNDLLAGQIPISFDTVVAVLPHVRSGKLKALAVTSPQRSQMLPDVPTIAESGYPGFDISSWVVLVAPNGLPADVSAKLKQALHAAFENADLRQKMKAAGFEPIALEVKDWAGTLAAETERLRAVAKQAGITAE